jgi:hypothetical protein
MENMKRTFGFKTENNGTRIKLHNETSSRKNITQSRSRLLVTANVIPSSPILTRVIRRNIPEDGILQFSSWPSSKTART